MALAILAVGAALAAALTGLAADRLPGLSRLLTCALIGLSGILAIAVGGYALAGGHSETLQLPIGLPWLPWHLRLDPLAGLFLIIVGLVTTAAALYAPAYIEEYRHGPQPLAVLQVFTGLFIAGMELVILAADAFAFMVAWELMSLASYFLVTYQHQHAANRRAGFLYLIMAHISGLAILLGFGVLAAFGGAFTFEAMRAAPMDLLWSSVAFSLALLGFGMKAGLMPLHAWLPEAHPVAPSHISALMSGVMLKVAVYGFIRVVFDLLPEVHWGWGVVLLIIGSASALFGILYALLQSDLKRLLAYSSAENIGIIFVGLGLAVIFIGSGHLGLGVLGLVAALYHCLNHALFKGLLFLGAGAVIHHTHEHNLEHMGGLLRQMPWTGLLFLIGIVSISALPPLNGFVSEWLTFQAALQAPALESGVLRAVIPLSAALLALAAALAAAGFVKAYGIAFLGQARTRRVRHAREVSRGMRAAMGLLAAGCVLFGVFATPTVGLLTQVPAHLLGEGLPSATQMGWLWLTPIAPQVASYSAPLIFGGVVAALGVWLFIRFVLRPRGKVGPILRGPAWDCGFGPLSPRMQYTAESFSQPFRQVFAPAWRLDERLERSPRPGLLHYPAEIRYQSQVGDITWAWVYQPVERLVHRAARLAGWLQTGHLRHYLAYSFLTVLVLLWLIT